MLSEKITKALIVAASGVIVACFISILVLSRALSFEKEKRQRGIGINEAVQVELPESTLNLIPGSEAKHEEPILTFAVFGGTADRTGRLEVFNEPALRNTIASIKSQNPNLAFVLGDIASGTVSQINASANLTAWLEVATEYFPESFYYPCFGLQESAHVGRNKILSDDENQSGNDKKVEKNYKVEVFSELFDEFVVDEFCNEIYGRTSYYIRIDDCNFIVLNTKWYEQMDRISDTVRSWIKKISQNGAKFNLVFMYGTPYPTYSIKSEMDADYSTTTDDIDGKPNSELRDDFWKLIDSLPGAVVFCGSEQLYVRKVIDDRYGDFNGNAFQINCAGLQGTFDSAVNDPHMLDSDPIYREHYVIGRVYENHIAFDVIDILDSAIIDSFRIYHESEHADTNH